MRARTRIELRVGRKTTRREGAGEGGSVEAKIREENARAGVVVV